MKWLILAVMVLGIGLILIDEINAAPMYVRLVVAFTVTFVVVCSLYLTTKWFEDTKKKYLGEEK